MHTHPRPPPPPQTAAGGPGGAGGGKGLKPKPKPKPRVDLGSGGLGWRQPGWAPSQPYQPGELCPSLLILVLGCGSWLGPPGGRLLSS